MSLYITPENQTLLWTTIHKIPAFEKNISNHRREEWFRSIIEKFYESNRMRSLTTDELKLLNRETIVYMVNQCKLVDFLPVDTVSATPFGSSFSADPITNLSLEQSSEVTRDYLSNLKKEELNKQFLERRQEYDNMIQRPIREIDFRFPTEEEPIKNMDELIQRHRSAYQSTPTVEATKPTSSLKKITIDKVIHPPEKKSVQWNPELEDKRADPVDQVYVSFDADQKQFKQLSYNQEYLPLENEPAATSLDKVDLYALKEEIRQEMRSQIEEFIVSMKREIRKSVAIEHQPKKYTTPALSKMSSLFQPTPFCGENVGMEMKRCTPFTVENAESNVAFSLENRRVFGDLNVKRCKNPRPNIQFADDLGELVPLDHLDTESQEVLRFSRELV